jgi:threonine aldolase
MFALDNHRERIVEDHANARGLAEHLAQVPGLRVDLSRVQTNIVMIDIERGTVAAIIELAREQGVLLGANTVSARAHATGEVRANHQLRVVCHLDVTREQVMRAASIIAEIAGKL